MKRKLLKILYVLLIIVFAMPILIAVIIGAAVFASIHMLYTSVLT